MRTFMLLGDGARSYMRIRSLIGSASSASLIAGPPGAPADQPDALRQSCSFSAPGPPGPAPARGPRTRRPGGREVPAAASPGPQGAATRLCACRRTAGAKTSLARVEPIALAALGVGRRRAGAARDV